MTSLEVKKKLYSDSPDAVFDYKGKTCGITPIYEDEKQRYEAWYGETLKVYYSLDEVMSDPLYDGKSLAELVDNGLAELDWQ